MKSESQVGSCKGLAFTALALVFALTAHGQVVTVGNTSGTVQADDACWTGGAIFTTVPIAPPGTNTGAVVTVGPPVAGILRYGSQFSCTIPIQSSIPWLVTFHFVEPCADGGGCSATVAAGQRQFSVTVNDTPALQNLDIFGNVGALAWLQRSVLVWPSTSNTLRIVFSSSVRTAVVSAIDYNTVALPQMWQAFTAGTVTVALPNASPAVHR